MKNRQKWIIWMILMGATVLRLYRIGARSIQYDDAFSYFLSIQSLSNIISGTAADTMPPFYYFLLHFWSFVGTSIWFLRLLSLIFSLAIVFLVYKFEKMMFGDVAAYIAAFITAISPFQIYHAQELRMYTILLLAQLSYSYFFVKIFYYTKENTGRNWFDPIFLVISGIVALYSHSLAIFGLIFADLILIFEKKWKQLFKLISYQGIMILFFIPWLFYLPGQIQKVQTAFWTPRPGLLEILQAILVFTINLPLKGLLLYVGAILSIEVIVLVIFEVVRQKKTNKNIFLLIWMSIIPPVSLFIVSYLMRPVFVPRAFIISSIGYYMIAGVLTAKSLKRGGGTLILIGFVLASIISLPAYYSFSGFPRSPYLEMTNYLSQEYKNTEIILHDNKLSFFPSHYYAPDLQQAFLADQPGSQNDTLDYQTQQSMDIFPVDDVDSAIENKTKIYFVVFEQAIQDYQSEGYDSHPVLNWLQKERALEKQVKFGDLWIYEFK